MYRLTPADRLGLVRPALDAHTLGIASVAQLLADCGYTAVMAGAETCAACAAPEAAAQAILVRKWIEQSRLTALGFSYRLDPRDGAEAFARLVHHLESAKLLRSRRGPIRALYFAGLPEACELVRRRCPATDGVFTGDEMPAETLRIFGIESGRLSQAMTAGLHYDDDRLAFGRDLIRRERYRAVQPVGRRAYAAYGTAQDTLIQRLRHGRAHDLPPLMRAHVGPYLADRSAAVQLFNTWTGQLAKAGFMDILSIGTSQLTQSHFGEEWGGRPNGGGVPLNSPAEFAAVWQAARPMLVRAYAGTRNILALAGMFEQTIHMAWHALSFWWFCRIDGRGPNSVRQNLEEHCAALRYIAAVGKPFEPNIPHHFAFRGADDVTYIVSALLAVHAAKLAGVRQLVLQVMLNTPKATWGVADLAKVRALLILARELEDRDFRLVLQPRGGLDYFAADPERAKAQLAAVTALMDDLEPRDSTSPPIIHVVSYSEAFRLADPDVVNESIKITRQALGEYRCLRAKGEVDDMTQHPEVVARTRELLAEARLIMRTIQAAIPRPYTPAGLYQIFADGFLPVPYLWEGRDEFRRAAAWQTRLVRGSMKVVDQHGNPIDAARRMRLVSNARAGDALA